MKQLLLINILSLIICSFNAFAAPDPSADLAAAVQACDIDFLKIAINSGANANDGSKMDDIGNTQRVPIFYSVKYCSEDFLIAHIAAGADLNWEQPDAISTVVFNVFDMVKSNDIKFAADRVQFLLRNGANPNPVESTPPLLNTDLVQSKKMVDTLLNYGADINAKITVYGDERNILSLFLENNFELYLRDGFELTRYLLEVGAPAQSDNLYFLMVNVYQALDAYQLKILSRKEFKEVMITLLSLTEKFLTQFPDQKFDYVDYDNNNAFAAISEHCGEVEQVLGGTSVEARYCHRIKDAIEPRM